jgi:hypothetical protein
VCPSDVLLQLRPSLPDLRRKSPSIVQPVHRYYGAVRLLQHVHVRRTALAFTDRPSHFPKAYWRSPGYRACCLVSVPGLFDYAGPDSHSRLTLLPRCLPLSRNRVGILFFRVFEAQSPRPLHLRLTLRNPPHDVFRKTRGQDRVACSFPVGLLHPLQHAGLPRRTPSCLNGKSRRSTRCYKKLNSADG